MKLLVPLPSQRMWLIRHRQTYLGVHVSEPVNPELTTTHLFAFKRLDHAKQVRQRLCNHSGSHGTWPSRVLEPGATTFTFGVQSGVPPIDCPISIDEYPFETIMELASLEGMALSLLELDDLKVTMHTCRAVQPVRKVKEHLESLFGLETLN